MNARKQAIRDRVPADTKRPHLSPGDSPPMGSPSIPAYNSKRSTALGVGTPPERWTPETGPRVEAMTSEGEAKAGEGVSAIFTERIPPGGSEEVLYVRITCGDGRRLVVERAATETDIQRFPGAFAEWSA